MLRDKKTGEIAEITKIVASGEIKTNSTYKNKIIRSKRIAFGSLPTANVTKRVPHDLDITAIEYLNVYAIAVSALNYVMPLPFVTDGIRGNVSLAISETDIEIRSDIDRSMFDAFVTIEYIYK